jgi:hypothetical protein
METPQKRYCLRTIFTLKKKVTQIMVLDFSRVLGLKTKKKVQALRKKECIL